MQKGIRFAVFAAEKQTAEQVCKLLHAWSEEICVQIAIDAGDAAVLPDAEQAARYMLLFVDSSGLNADALAQLQTLRTADPECGLVLLADDDRAAIDVYPCHPNALVPKPVTYNGLEAAMERCSSYWQRGLGWLDLPLQHRRVRLPLYQLNYAEAAGRHTILYRAGGLLQVNCSLSALEKQLPHPPFLRCQKSFLVHLGAIRRLTGGELIMCNDRVITVARSRLRQVQGELSEYRCKRGMQEGTE